ncbi:MAG: NAD(P)-dependent oxidoreductase [Phycisphaerae bacterium]|nr:NAD(P)-dependent oxidoreductase [Phycisphaerae bacterium]
MRVIVTGATGFIGSHLVRHLATRGDGDVFALVRDCEDTHSVQCHASRVARISDEPDVATLREVLRDVQVDVVAHLAALVEVQDDPARIAETIQANVTFGTLVLQACVEAGVRGFVNTGSFWESMDQGGAYRPVNLYAACKRAFADILHYYADAHDLRAVTLTLFGTYGPGDPRPNVFSLFEQSIEAADPIAFSPGQQLLDVLHVDDVVRAYEKAIEYVRRKESAAVECFEIGSGEALTLRDVAGLYEQARGLALKIAWGACPYRRREVHRRCADIGPAEAVLGWRPQWDVRAGVARMIEQNHQRAQR